MVQFIRYNRIFPGQNGLKQPGIGIKAGGIKNRLFHTQKVSHTLFKGFMDSLGTTDKTHRRQSKSPLIITVFSCLNNVGVVRQTEVIISAHINDFPAIGEGNIIFLLRRYDPLIFP